MATRRTLPTATRAATCSFRALLRSRDAPPVGVEAAGSRVSTVSALTAAAAQQHNHSSSSSVRRAALLASSTAALSLCAVILADTEHIDARCESLLRLDPSNRRHTGSAPQKRSATDCSECESECERDDAAVSDASERLAAAAVPPPQQTAYFDADYDTKSLVGAGSFGMVLQCVRKRDGHVAAVKMVQDVDNARAEIARETQALAFIERSGGHDHIVRYDGTYAHNGFHYIVTEFVAGESLFTFLQKRRRVDVCTALQLVAQLADALAFLQARGIVHRDLKPENIMVVADADQRLTLKVIDFGSAATMAEACGVNDPGDGDASTATQAPALSGTRCYWSPEALLHDEMTSAMDVWALGCVLFILLAGRHPFDPSGTASEQQIVARIVAHDRVALEPSMWADVPHDVQDLVRGLLEKDPRARFGVHDVRSHARVRAACEQ